MEKSIRKTKIVILIVILGVIVFLICSYAYANNIAGGTGKYDDETAQFVRITPRKTLDKMMSKKEGIYYYGFPACPWCQELLPVFNTVLKKKHLKAYVVNVRSKKYTSEDNIKLKRFFTKYINKNEKVTVPLIIMIKGNKEIKYHISTVDGHNAKIQRMTSQQFKKLTVIIEKMCNWYIK